MAPTTAAMPGAGMRLAGMAAHGAGAFGFGVVVVAARFTEITESTESHCSKALEVTGTIEMDDIGTNT